VLALRREGEFSVAVAMIAVRVVQVPVDQIVHVVAMRDRLVAAASAMLVRGVMAGSRRGRGAAIGVLGVDGDVVLVAVPFVRVVEMAVVQIVDVALVPDGDVTAIGPVLVLVVGVNRMIKLGHGFCLPYRLGRTSG
jgi:hypothetical protein